MGEIGYRILNVELFCYIEDMTHKKIVINDLCDHSCSATCYENPVDKASKDLSIPQVPFYFMRHGETEWNQNGLNNGVHWPLQDVLNLDAMTVPNATPMMHIPPNEDEKSWIIKSVQELKDCEDT